MREIRVYQPGSYQPGETIELSEEVAHHVGVVLRMKEGDNLTLFCGNNNEFSATIATVHKKKIHVNILSACHSNKESSLEIHLIQGVSKGDRMDFVVQKAVELGVSSITPIITARCAVKLDEVRKVKKQQQWQAIAIAACEQSGRNQLPTINPIISWSEYLSNNNNYLKIALSPTGSLKWREMENIEQKIQLLIGPEGGLNDEESTTLTAHKFLFLKLGPRILRTETAAISALSVLQAFWGDL